MIDIINIVYFLILIPLFCAGFEICLKFLPTKPPRKVFYGLNLLSSLVCFGLTSLLAQYAITYRGFILEDNLPIYIIKEIIIYFGFYIDNLALIFVCLASLIFLLINLSSYKYFRKNPQGFERFYIYLSLMQFFTTGFFISSNLVQSFVFLTTLGLMQYFFANFYFQKPIAQSDSKKVWQVNVFSDALLFIAVIVFLYFSSLVSDIFTIPTLGYNNINSIGLYSFAGLNPVLFSLISLLFIWGALIRAFGFPFCSKLHLCSNAPNPAFILFLSPIVLGEGVYLIARIYPLMNLVPITFEILKIVGAIGAILGALVALKETEFKKILAWGAVSQISVCIFAMGFKLYSASIFHLICFSLSLSLIAFCMDTVSNSCGGQENIRFLGGLRSKLPTVAFQFLIGAISLSTIMFSGFYSKNKLLAELQNQNEFFFVFVLLVVGFLSAFYIFRLYFRTFEGEYKGSYEVTKPSRLMNFSIFTLSVITIATGFLIKDYIDKFLSVSTNVQTQLNPFLMLGAFVLCILGYYISYKIYFTHHLNSLSIRSLRRIAKDRFGMDYFLKFIFEDFISFLGSIFGFIENLIISFIYKIPKFLTRIFSYIFTNIQSKEISKNISTIFWWLMLMILIIVIIIFKGGI